MLRHSVPRHFDFGILPSYFDLDIRHYMLQCIVVTPERTLYDEPADFVALTLYDGEIGVAPAIRR